jgi:hypothetical protein
MIETTYPKEMDVYNGRRFFRKYIRGESMCLSVFTSEHILLKVVL